ncbi:MAG: 16S rRNA (adenine(1518)-N(6)/adenine(1519)-N(6))-dimethyltransferase RsmA [Candidatus Omnitrophota bacterium]|nr:16S rRNA (adenine(1518)-N(6)/adenine(1519)-N(6))-dimethyltransferase RsmA [Candidatus Omnitrophota bacterium]
MRIPAKKSLGQNFLIDQNIRGKIVDALDLKPTDILLEIGSGRGELTELISQRAGEVYALEIDRRLLKTLTDSLVGRKNIRVINQDILKLDLERLINQNKIKAKIKVFGNIPYYISSPIIEHLLNFHGYLSEIFITVQKEFAARVVAQPGSKEYSSFSCFVQYYTVPKIIFHISKNCFRPSPKVDSSFLGLKIREVPAVSVRDEGLFFKIIRSAFNQRRKILSNSLQEVVTPGILSVFFTKTGLNPNIRPECLTLENFALLANLQFLSKKA